jgi:glycerol-3-phosphate acyltransferase PlsY
METFLFGFAGYLIGSIPVAFLLARKTHGVDLRQEGSRNIGARNAFEATGNKRLGFIVLILDMLKGIVPLVILDKLGYCEAIPLVAVTIVLGHCYPLWLKFRGGRGLATGAAIALTIAPDILLCWLIIYPVAGFIKKQVHLQAFIATAGCILFVLIAYKNLPFFTISFVCMTGKETLQYSMLAILFIILSRHIQPVYTLLRGEGS